MNKTLNYRHTMAASFTGYITQAMTINFSPLLFVAFSRTFDISLAKIGSLITINFCIQLTIDLLSAKFLDKTGYRAAAVAAHIFAATGFILMGILPFSFDNHFVGILISTVSMAIGGGLTEVIISPMVEACPTENKSASMSLLHSFYCWGQVMVTLFSTLFFIFFGIENWKILSFIWAIIPALNAVYFCFVPIYNKTDYPKDSQANKPFKNRIFILLLVLMLCAGASEIAMSQWASTFAEVGLGVDKSAGDLLGPMMFAVLMGISRSFYAAFSEKIDLKKYIMLSSLLCIVSYILAAFSPIPLLSLCGCGLCGLSVGIMWPGVYSVATKTIPDMGTAMFAFLALAGDAGCTCGPTLVNIIAGSGENSLKTGFAFAIVFPLTLLAGISILRKVHTDEKTD